MIVLGLILIVAAAAAVIVAVIAGGDSVTLSAFDVDLDSPVWGVFAAGIAAGLLLMLGILAIVAGVNRSRARREEIEYLREQVARHERKTGREADEPEVSDWLGQAHRAATGTGTAAAAPAEPTAHSGATSGASPLYRHG
ncbi:hypothetical protein [Jiangella sp. DSM 45060]|uniref:hypothetical protein n=1 Tax=Jiangella sp. DSM 45060 TaxID=1798224 RepID=UPI00087DBF2C|nr:hypothetical protein [Jiangella sp. DSM 45060]SDT59285.1 hypothetical protein SAMN04515669_4979 [Jiangella sp. DSM 45060]